MLFNIQVEGSLASAPELRRTSGGTSICKLRLIHTERRPGKDGSWIDGASMVLDVLAWGRLAESAVKLNRGDTILVHGRHDLEARAIDGTGYLTVTADMLYVSMRFADAASLRTPKATAPGTLNTVQTPSGEVSPAERFAMAAGA